MFWEIINTIRVIQSRSLFEVFQYENKNPKFYVGQRIIKNYGNNLTFVIDEIDFEQNPLTKFNCNGKLINYVQYMRQNYQI
jgi:hypothetical protein